MYKKYVKEFIKEREYRPLRLRRSSRDRVREKELNLEYDIEEHLLYRGEELAYLSQCASMKDELEELMCILCPLLTGKVCEELLLPYLLPDVIETTELYRSSLHDKSKDVMCYLLNVCGKYKSKSKLYIYLDHCPEGDDRLIYQCRTLNKL
jgi:hypothetical protein